MSLLRLSLVLAMKIPSRRRLPSENWRIAGTKARTVVAMKGKNNSNRGKSPVQQEAHIHAIWCNKELLEAKDLVEELVKLNDFNGAPLSGPSTRWKVYTRHLAYVKIKNTPQEKTIFEMLHADTRILLWLRKKGMSTANKMMPAQYWEEKKALLREIRKVKLEPVKKEEIPVTIPVSPSSDDDDNEVIEESEEENDHDKKDSVPDQHPAPEESETRWSKIWKWITTPLGKCVSGLCLCALAIPSIWFLFSGSSKDEEIHDVSLAKESSLFTGEVASYGLAASVTALIGGVGFYCATKDSSDEITEDISGPISEAKQVIKNVTGKSCSETEIVVGIAVFVFFLAVVAYFLCSKRKAQRPQWVNAELDFARQFPRW